MSDTDLARSEEETAAESTGSGTESSLSETPSPAKGAETAADPEEEPESPEEEKKVLFLKAAQGYGMILGFGVGYILSGILSEFGLEAGKFECVIICMLAGMAIGYLVSKRQK